MYPLKSETTRLEQRLDVLFGHQECCLAQVDAQSLDGYVVDVVCFVEHHHAVTIELMRHHLVDLGVDQVLVVADDHVGVRYNMSGEEIRTPSFVPPEILQAGQGIDP